MNISGLFSFRNSVQLYHREWTLVYPLNFPEFWLPALPGWSVWMDSNHRPRAYQARALTTWATNRYSVLILPHLSPPVCFSFVLFSFTLISEEWKVKSFGWKSFAFSSSYFHSYWVSFRSLKIEQQVKVLCLSALSPSFLVFAYLQTFDVTATLLLYITFSIERRWSSRTFRYGYLVTT